MMQGHQERAFGLHDQTGHISRAVFNNNIINPKRKMHLKFQGQEFLLQNQKYFHHQVSVNAFDSTLFIHITNKASRLSQVVFILKPLCEEFNHSSNETKGTSRESRNSSRLDHNGQFWELGYVLVLFWH